MDEKKKNQLINAIIWVLEGILVGFGAILPGVSGGTLCVAFGMYRPIIDLLSDLRATIRRYWFMLGCFMLGVFIGFVGLSGLAAWLLSVNTAVVTCVFIGFILGTVPQLLDDAGKQGRGRSSYISLVACFAVMLGVLYLIENAPNLGISEGFLGYLFCGVLWGLSFIVPGLSSSSLLLFFGLYQPMLEGISRLDLLVIIPMGVGMLACLLLLARLMSYAFGKFYAPLSHGIVGIVIATTLMILPAPESVTFGGIAVYLLCIVCGAALSYLFTRICARLKERG